VLCVAAGLATLQAQAAPAADAAAAAHLARVRSAWQAMQQDNEAIPHGVPDGKGWKWRPQITMGAEPYAASIPKWYNGTRYAEWPNITLWFTLYETADGSGSSNTSVEIGGLELWVLRASDNTWELVEEAAAPTWYNRYREDGFAIGQESKFVAPLADSGVALPMTPGYLVHGGLPVVPMPWLAGKADVRAILATVRHRLVKTDPAGVDDRAAARYAVSAGVDFWPERGKPLNSPYNPASGTGPFIQVNQAWRYASFLVLKKGDQIDSILALPAPALRH